MTKKIFRWTFGLLLIVSGVVGIGSVLFGVDPVIVLLAGPGMMLGALVLDPRASPGPNPWTSDPLEQMFVEPSARHHIIGSDEWYES